MGGFLPRYQSCHSQTPLSLAMFLYKALQLYALGPSIEMAGWQTIPVPPQVREAQQCVD